MRPARQRTVAGGVTGALPGASIAGAWPLALGRRGIRTARGDSRPLESVRSTRNRGEYRVSIWRRYLEAPSVRDLLA